MSRGRGFILSAYEVYVMLTEFGKRLRDIRLERNLLLKDMADSLRCSVVQLSAIESGTQAIPDGIIARLSVIYELSEG